MDWIFIRDLPLDTRIGVFAWEQAIEQRLFLDVDLAWDIRLAAQTDDLAHALNYAAVAEHLQAWARDYSCQLIERLAEYLAQCLLREFNIPRVCLTLYKPGAVPTARTLGVRIEREREP
ncbi:MAG TPA: dihydroneopterin aldolase [Cellvibrionaceae bacterium]|nr:dihydroneopterin aldolase [Cellvibrionaceae bacterium]